MIHIDIICVGKLKETYLKEAIAEYTKRLSKYCVCNMIEIADEPIPAKSNPSLDMQIKEKEGTSILRAIKKDSYVIALELTGKQYSSEEFSAKIEQISMQSSHITFIIGGSLGIAPSVLQICKEKICFSKMTFPHQLIRVFLVEQLFRACKISNHETYHR